MKPQKNELSVPLWDYTDAASLRRIWKRVPGVRYPGDPDYETEKPEELNITLEELHARGYMTMQDICKRIGRSRGTVRAMMRGSRCVYWTGTNRPTRCFSRKDVEKEIARYLKYEKR